MLRSEEGIPTALEKLIEIQSEIRYDVKGSLELNSGRPRFGQVVR
jgi:hypothetical protein